MTNPIRRGFHSEMANLFADDIRFKRSNYYYFLGKLEPWGNPDVFPEVMAPDSDSENDAVRSNSLFMKKISPNDISEVCTKFEWVSGVVFAKWDNTKDMSQANFYCSTSDNSVYKCLDNVGGTPSTVKPTGKSFSVIRTSDGYLWKYMYTIPAFKRTRFSSLIHLPVQRALTDSFYNKGAINDVVVDSGGSGYPDAPLTTISVVGATTGSGAVGTIQVGAGGAITGAVITNGGSGYTAGVALSVTSTGGVNGVIRAIITAGVVTGITVVTPGVGYANSNPIVFSLGGAILVPVVSRDTGTIIDVKIINAGAGYTAPPVLTVNSVGGLGGGKYGNPTALITSVIYLGSLVRVNIQDPGVNYPASNDTSIVVTGTGTDARFTPVIYAGAIIGVVTENPGTLYSSVNLKVVGSGTGAQLTAVIQTSDFVSDQSIVEQTTVAGAIYSIEPTLGGTGYTVGAKIQIVGDGTGAAATPVILNGAVIRYNVTAYGSGYTYASVVITDTARSVVGSVDAKSYAILPPRGGHGKDAVNELFGNTIVINSSLRQERFLGSIIQDYRQFGILKNPKDLLTGNLLTGEAYLAAYKVQLDTVDGLVLDQLLSQGATMFRVVFIESGNRVYLQRLGTRIVPPIGLLTGSAVDGGVAPTYTSMSVLSSPSVDKYSGSLLYVSNESPFSLTENQGIIIKTFLTF